MEYFDKKYFLNFFHTRRIHLIKDISMTGIIFIVLVIYRGVCILTIFKHVMHLAQCFPKSMITITASLPIFKTGFRSLMLM